MESIAQLGIKVDSTDIKSATNELNKLSTQSAKTEKSIDLLSAKTSVLNAKNAVLAIATSATVSQLVKMSDTWTSISSRLNLATKSTEEYTKAQQELFKIAQTTKTSLEGTVDLYSRIARSTESLKLSQDTLLSITETINKTGIISGATTQQMEAGLMQLGQAFSAGALRGEELNSILEQMPRLAKAIADGMNIEVGALKDVASQGKITSKVLIDAITSQTDSINNEFNGMAMTIDQASTTMSNAILTLVGKLNDATGASKDTADGIREFSKFLEDNADSIIEWGIVAYASTSQLADGVNLLWETLENTAQLILAGINTTVYGALRSISGAILNITEALNSVGLSSDASLSSIKSINDNLNKSYEDSKQLAVDSGNEISDAYKKASLSAEDRIKMMTVEKQISMENAEMAKVVSDEETKKSKKKIELTKEEIKALKDAQKAEEDKNKALLEITQIGMSEYEKSLLSIADKLNSYAEAGLSVNQILEANTKLLAQLNAQTLSETLIEDLSYYERKVQLQSDSLAKELELQGIAYSNAVLNIENSDKTIEQKERLIALETELYELSIAKLEEDSNTEFQDTLLEFQDEALQRQIDLNQAMYDFSGSFDGISGQISNVSKSMIAMAGISLKTKKAEIDLNKKYEKEFTKAAGNVAKTKALEIQYTKDSSELTAQSNEAEMAGYANLAGAMASAFEQGSAGAIAFTAVQSALGIASSWTAIAGAWALPFPANLPAVAAVTAAVMPIIAQLGGSSGGGGGSVSVPSVADTAQENLDFENTLITDRLDRQIELLEQLNLQGSAEKLKNISAGIQFDYEQSSARNTIRKKMEENLGAWQSKDQVSIFNSQQSDIGYKGDMIDYFMKDEPVKIWEDYANRTTGGINAWWSQYMDVTQRQFEEMQNEFQGSIADFIGSVIDSVQELEESGDKLKEIWDGVTNTSKYADIAIKKSFDKVNELRGNNSFADYIEEQIENIATLQNELSPENINLLLSESKEDLRARIELVNQISEKTGMAFDKGAEDVLNYIDSIEAVSEMMTTSRDNIKSYLDSFKTSEQLLQDLADTLNLKVANSAEELNLLFNQLSSDIYGLTDAELELLEANKDYLISISEIAEATSNAASNLKSFIDSFATSFDTLKNMANNLNVNVVTTWEDLYSQFDNLIVDGGITDEVLSYLNASKTYIQDYYKDSLTEQKNNLQDKLNAENDYYKTITSSISSITSILSTLDNAIEKLRGASETSETSLSKFYLSMAETQSLMGGNDYDAIKESLSKTVGYSSVLMDTANFRSQEEMAYAQQLASNQLEDMDLTLNDELDYLEKIEENTRNTVAALTQSISNMGTQISDSINNIPTYSDISNKVSESVISKAYQSVLGRSPDAEGLTYWTKELESGNISSANLTASIARGADANDIDESLEWLKANNIISGEELIDRLYSDGLISDSKANSLYDEHGLIGYDAASVIHNSKSYPEFKNLANLIINDPYKRYGNASIVPFANGGIITGPTLGLIGEAGYSEAVIPLKNPNDPLNQAALIGEVRELRSEVAYLNTLNEKQTATQIKTLSETRMIKGLSA